MGNRLYHALGNVLLKSWVVAVIVAEQMYPIMAVVFQNYPATLEILFRNGLRNLTEFKVLTWPPSFLDKFPDLNPIAHLWHVLQNMSNPWWHHLTFYRI